jgi:hypothetical protein
MASHASHSQLSLPGDGPSAGLGSSLAFLGIGYVLILAAPLLSSHFQAILSQGPALGQGSGMLPAAAAAGIALVGAGAMMMVLSRLVRDVETRPYASIAPVLTVFTGFVLMGLRARLPFEGLASQHLGVLALSLSLCGGALICREGLFVQAMGWLLALLPPVVVAYALAAVSGSDIDVFAALRRADSQVRVYVVLMSLSAVALGLVATAARIVSSSRASAAKAIVDVPMPRLLPAPAAQPQQRVYTPTYHAGEPPGGYATNYALAPAAAAYVPNPLLGLEDDDPLTPPKRRTGLIAAAALLLVGAGALAAYQLVLVPRQQVADQAAKKAADAQGAAQRAQAEAVRAKESEAARAQLEALVAAGEARAAAPVAPVAEATPPVQGEAPAAAPAQPSAAPVQPTAAPALSAPAVARAAPAARVEARVEAPRSTAPAKAAAKAGLAKAAKAAPLKQAKPERAAKLAAAPKAEAGPVAQAVKPEAPKAEAARPAAAKPAKAVKAEPPESTNSADLDLDQLVNKALKHKGGSSVSASDDPLLGL